MTSSSFASPLDCLTSFLGISLSRAVSSFGLPVYSSIHSRRITKCPKIGHYARVVFPKLAEAAGNARGVPIDMKFHLALFFFTLSDLERSIQVTQVFNGLYLQIFSR